MHNFQQKSGFKKVIQSKPFLILLGIIIIFFSFNIFNLFGKMSETIKNRRIAEDKNTELQLRKEKLLKDIDKLKTDDGKEAIFRENYGLSKEGEEMIMVVEDEKKKTTETESPKEEKSFWRNLFK